MPTNPLYSSILERLERINLTSRDRIRAELNLRKAVTIIEIVFGAAESAGRGGRKVLQRMRIFLRRQKRRHAAA